MELGKRLRQARMEAGLSQRQLCGDEITRNMLSQIENGSAKPSMATLQYLAGRLGKPISFFLEEQAVTSPNLEVMASARDAFSAGDPALAVKLLENYRSPDNTFDPEYALLLYKSLLSLSAQAIAEQKFPYAVYILEQAGQLQSIYIDTGLERQRLLLLHQADPANAAAIAAAFPTDDRELLLRGQAALDSGDASRCAQLLAAAWDQSDSRISLLMGRARLALQEYDQASQHLLAAESQFPAETAPLLEACYRELGNFQKAYEYARKQMEKQG
jgi:transcriptional regulator with XRE-family HTH domain